MTADRAVPASGPDPVSPRRRIAEATCGLVAERGLDGATFRRVAEELGCTTGYISHYFSSKDALLEATLRTAVRQIVASNTSLAPVATLDEWLERTVQFMPSDASSRRFWRVLIAFQAASLASEHLTQVLGSYSDVNRPELIEFVTAAMPPGTPDADIVRCSNAIWVFVDGFGTTAALNPDALHPDQIRAALRGAVHGLLADLPTKGDPL